MLRRHSAAVARYLLACSTLGDAPLPSAGSAGEPCPHPASLMPCPDDAGWRRVAKQHLEAPAPPAGEVQQVVPQRPGNFARLPAHAALSHLPPNGSAGTMLLLALKECVGHAALAPLLSYLECQRWLAAHHPEGCDLEGGDPEAFAAALQQHMLSRCLASAAGPVAAAEAQLGYRCGLRCWCLRSCCGSRVSGSRDLYNARTFASPKSRALRAGMCAHPKPASLRAPAGLYRAIPAGAQLVRCTAVAAS